MAVVISGQAPPSDAVLDYRSGRPFIQGNAEFGRTSPTPRYECDSPSKVAEPGDLLLSVRAPVGALNVADRHYGIGRGLAALRVREHVDARFFAYALRAQLQELHAAATGTTFASVTAEDLKGLRLPCPAVGEQRQIADFLDAQVALIQRTIGLRHEQEALLLARRAAGVLAAVTGADHPSGQARGLLPWAHCSAAAWPVAKITYHARLGSGHTPSRNRPEWWTDCTIPWVTTGEVWQMRTDRLEDIEETRERISLLGLENSSAKLHPRGTVVLCRTAASAGYSAVMGADMATSQDLMTWTCEPSLNPYYLLWCLRAMRGDLLSRLATGSTHKTIYVPDIQTLRIPVPPRAEQDAIVAGIREANSRIDALVDLGRQHVALLEERKQALITAVVTGQLDGTTGRSVA